MDHKAQNSRLLKVLLWGGGFVALVVFVIPAILLFFANQDPQFRADVAAGGDKEAVREEASRGLVENWPAAEADRGPPTVLPTTASIFTAHVEGTHPLVRGMPWRISFESPEAGRCRRAEFGTAPTSFYEFCTRPDGGLYRVWFSGLSVDAPVREAGGHARSLALAANPDLSIEAVGRIRQLVDQAVATVSDQPTWIPVGRYWMQVRRPSAASYVVNVRADQEPGADDRVLR